ncbi:Pentatricopeptide repeat - like 10 [Theobroma cacao]|nr:Pentatricopeptide repeat - like 10 [Theobroma cacao]
MLRASLNPLNQSLTKSTNFYVNFIPKLPYSSSPSASSSLQTIQNSHSKPLSNPLYNLLPETQNPNQIVNLISSSLKQTNSQLIHLQNDIKPLIHHLSCHEITRVLLRFQSDGFSALTFFNWVKNDLGIKLSSHNYCYIIHILAWCKKFSLAMKLLCELIDYVKDCSNCENVFGSLVFCSKDCNFDPAVFDMLIKGYVRKGRVREGFMTFRNILEVGFLPSVISCNCLLNGLLRLNFVDQCWLLYEEMCRVGIHPNSYTFNILTHVFCKDGNADKINEFLERMEEEGFDPDLVTYNTLISSYCRKGRLNDAFYLYRIMYRRNVVPDLVSYTALMNGLCKEGRVREAHQLFHRMVHRGLSADIVSYNTLISGYCKEGRMQESKYLMHEMIGNGICPDSFTCRVLVEGYGKQGRLISALNLVVELRRFRVSVSSGIYDYLMVSLCHEDRPFAAKNLLGRISQDGYVPKLDIYNELIESFCRCDSVADALHLKAEMAQRRIKVDLVAYRALICCLALIHCYCKRLDFDKAESMLNFFAKEFQIFDTESYNCLVSVLTEDGDMNKLMELQDRMLKVGFAPNSLTCKFVIHDWKKRKFVENWRVFEGNSKGDCRRTLGRMGQRCKQYQKKGCNNQQHLTRQEEAIIKSPTSDIKVFHSLLHESPSISKQDGNQRQQRQLTKPFRCKQT